MKIALHEIKSDYPIDLTFTEKDQWALTAIQEQDEKDSAALKSFRNGKETKTLRPVAFQVALSRVGECFLVCGVLKTSLILICSRCANFFQFFCQPKFNVLYSKDRVMAGLAHIAEEEDAKPLLTNKGFARHAHDFLEPEQMDVNFLTDNFIDLKQVLVEQLQLEIPFQPLCKEDCKGLCIYCTADLNYAKCACAKIRAK